ncbi:MAG: peptide deformylase [Synechococcales cyanobacterium RM1_1_8]|nr:peptide deformylase [Synechococcales cyanobacterium RM1_1_8]
MTSQILVEKKKLKTPPLQVHHLGDRVLRQPAKRISKIDDSLRELIRQMLQTMYSEDGIGLAAPQVGLNKQLLVIDIDPEEASTEPLVMINPTIHSASKSQAVDQEGCLSIPGVFLDVQRPDAIEVSFKNELGRPQKLKVNDIIARVIQHEMDHLNGVLFVDRVVNKVALSEALKKQGFAVGDVKPIF